MSDFMGDLLEVLAKWSEEIDYENHDWDGSKLNLYVRIKKTAPKPNATLSNLEGRDGDSK